MVLYECHVGTDDSSGDWFERHVTTEGSACYSPNMPQEWSFCLATNAWAWVSQNLIFGFSKDQLNILTLAHGKYDTYVSFLTSRQVDPTPTRVFPQQLILDSTTATTSFTDRSWLATYEEKKIHFLLFFGSVTLGQINDSPNELWFTVLRCSLSCWHADWFSVELFTAWKIRLGRLGLSSIDQLILA